MARWRQRPFILWQTYSECPRVDDVAHKAALMGDPRLELVAGKRVGDLVIWETQYLIEAEYAGTHGLFDVRGHVHVQIVVNVMTKAWGRALSCGVSSAAVDGVRDGLDEIVGKAGRL
jgi:hypothetical protein